MGRSKIYKSNKKISKAKFKKWILIISIPLIICVPLVLMSINWRNIQIIYSTGSSAVFPLFQEMSSTYRKYQNTGKAIDVVVDSTGSGTGLEKILNNQTNIGNISYSPNVKKVKEYEKQWEENQIKTISWGIDGIGIVYKGDFDLDINQDNIDDIYYAFSGLKKLTYDDLGVKGNYTTLRPFSRTGGANKSGTTEAFIKNSGFDLNTSSNPELKEAIGIMEVGNYGANVSPTAESQFLSWLQVKGSNGSGQIIYLSTGFILRNIKDIEAFGFRVATYNKNQLTTETIQDGKYNWRRILNSLVSINHLNDTIITWVDWIFANYYSAELKKCFENVGIIQFNEEQLKDMVADPMKPNETFWVSDFSIKSLSDAELEPNWVYGVRI